MVTPIAHPSARRPHVHSDGVARTFSLLQTSAAIRLLAVALGAAAIWASIAIAVQ